MLPVYTALHAWLVVTADRFTAQPDAVTENGSSSRRFGGDTGQATAEYALVLVGAAAIALLLIGWAAKTDKVGKLFDTVVDNVVGRAR